MDDDADIPPARAKELRNLLAVAAALRRLAHDAPASEASLYVAAADSLARRAARMAGLFVDPPPQEPHRLVGLHRPVDLRV